MLPEWETGRRIDFIPHANLKIVQSDRLFPFSIDSVLLARFVRVPVRAGSIADLCTGNGIIPFLLTRRSAAKIIGVDIQPEVCALAEEGVRINKLDEQIRIVCGDVRKIAETAGRHCFDAVTCNPPYFTMEAAPDVKVNRHLAIARHELMMTLRNAVEAAALLLKQGGHFALVHRPERLVELLSLMRAAGVEPKRLQFVHPRPERAANLVLVEGTKDGRPGLTVLPAFFVHDDSGAYRKEVWE
ncbi:MAG: tRNA1(Val) (adenine(37)-N6)-methyltransferase [Sporolactobacillus sp.]